MTCTEICLTNITKTFGTTIAVDKMNLEINQGEFFSILGPSGCGKTTTLRIIAGLEKPTSGEVFLRDRKITDLPPYKRHIGMVFQDYALFPHMKIFDNIAFGLRMAGWSKGKIKTRVEELLQLIRLPGIESRYPSQLSGGQQQRVALARALAPKPEVLLLDEPLSNLDLKLRQDLRLELRRIHRESKVTTIFVTHDQGEALSLADRVMVMKDGNTVQIGSPSEVYKYPRSKWLASFLGDANTMTGMITGSNSSGYIFLSKNGMEFHIIKSKELNDKNQTTRIMLAIRPEAIRLMAVDTIFKSDNYDTYIGIVDNFAYIGASTRYVIKFENYLSEYVYVDIPESSTPWPVETELLVAFPQNKWIILED